MYGNSGMEIIHNEVILLRNPINIETTPLLISPLRNQCKKKIFHEHKIWNSILSSNFGIYIHGTLFLALREVCVIRNFDHDSY